MAEYKISGVWKNSNGVITHYAFHTIDKDGISRATKKSKSDAITLLENSNNSAVTWVWNYTKAIWVDGETVNVVNSADGKYLRTNPDNKLSDNLAHLIDYDWIQP